MYKIVFFHDKNGTSSIHEYIQDLSKKKGKDSRIKFNKVVSYIDELKLYGFHAGEPYIKHIEGEIWELRPLRDRIFFFCWCGNAFVLLHHFVKKTQKTPQKELEQAKRNMMKFIERTDKNGK
ncbi:hypothetical protein FACS1894198_6360 [Clostridia bacterium]|nr:hypothetical protein FACS1894198_6360 [Clostridia bacterium]